MEAPRFERLSVSSRREETSEFTLLRVGQLPRAWIDAYRFPGQFCALRLPEAEKPGYLAIASSPGETCLEFLVRGGGRFADALRALQPGDTLEVSHPMGKGFPLERARGRDLWMIAAGSGLAALRPVARAVAGERRAYENASLLLGARSRAHLPFAGDLPVWRAAGIEVTLATSQEAAEGAGREQGYVQDVLGRRAPDLSRAVVFACGMTGMIEAVRALVAKLGHGQGELHTNY